MAYLRYFRLLKDGYDLRFYTCQTSPAKAEKNQQILQIGENS